MSTQFAHGVIVDKWAGKSLTKVDSVVKNAVLVFGLVAATALCAQISIPLPFTPVPLTLQTFAVLAGAGALGAQRAVISQVLYIVAAIAGAPILAPQTDGSHTVGLDVAQLPTLGYLIGFIVSSAVVGTLANRGGTRNSVSTLASFVLGSAVIYLIGATWLAHVFEMDASTAFANGVRPFLIGDVIKAVAAGAILPSLWKLVRD